MNEYDRCVILVLLSSCFSALPCRQTHENTILIDTFFSTLRSNRVHLYIVTFAQIRRLTICLELD